MTVDPTDGVPFVYPPRCHGYYGYCIIARWKRVARGGVRGGNHLEL